MRFVKANLSGLQAASTHIPYRLSYNCFDTMRHVIHAYAKHYPDPIYVNRGNMSMRTLIDRIRGCFQAQILYNWDDSLDNVKLLEHWKTSYVTVHTDDIAAIKLRATVRRIKAPSPVLPSDVAVGEAENPAARNYSPEDVEALVRLLDKKILAGPVTILNNPLSVKQLEALALQYNVIFELDGSTLIVC